MNSLPKYSAKVIDPSYRVGVREKNMGVSEYRPLVGLQIGIITSLIFR
jgi:hypothetical protein